MAAEQLLSTVKGVTPVTGTPPKPLPRDAFIDPRNGSERPINNPLTNPNYQKDLEQSLKNAEINKQIVSAAENTKVAPEIRQQQIDQLQAQKAAMGGITPEVRGQYVAEMNLPQNLYTPPVLRDMDKENATISRLGGAPSNEKEFQQTLLATYGKSGLEQMGATVGAGGAIQVFDPTKLKAAGFSDAQIASLSQAGQAVNVAQKELNATPKPTNAMLGVLQSALKAASGVGQQEIGTSKVFEAAGIPTTGALGYGALAASMQQRRAEMGQAYDSYANTLQSVGGQMSDLYSNTLEAYNSTMQRYDKQVASLEKLNAEERDYKKQLDLMELRSKQEREDLVFAENLKAKYAQPVFNPATGEQMTFDPSTGWRTNSNGGVVATTSDSSNSSTYNVPTDTLSKIFGVGSVGDWCGVYASKISTAEKVGNTWAEKVTHIDKQINPVAGDKLLIPLGVKTSKSDWGHVATVIDYNAQTGEIKVVESNKDGRQTDTKNGAKGVVTIGSYNINDLKNSYGSNWGFVNGELKPQYKTALEQFKAPQAATGLSQADIIKKAQAAGMDISTKAKVENILSNYANFGVVPGGESGVTKIPADQRSKLDGSEPVKKVRAANNFNLAIKAYKDLVEKTADLERWGENKVKLDSAYSNLKVQFKNASELGAIAAADIPLIEGSIKPMTKEIYDIAGQAQFALSGGKAGVLGSLDTALRLSNDRKAQAASELVSLYPEYVNSDYFASLLGKPPQASEKPSAGWLDQLLGKVVTKASPSTGNIDNYLNSFKL